MAQQCTWLQDERNRVYEPESILRLLLRLRGQKFIENPTDRKYGRKEDEKERAIIN